MVGGLEEIKQKLKSYAINQVVFSDHAIESMLLRGGTKEEILSNLSNPERLVNYYADNKKLILFFKLSNTRTLKLPVVLTKKHLYYHHLR
jgi:hypothetical protein